MRPIPKGRSLEAHLDALHLSYEVQGRAFVRHHHPPVQVNPGTTRRDRRGRTTFTGCWKGRGPPDYQGIAGPPVQAFCFDAKECAPKAWPFARLPSHQARDLDSFEQRGGRSFIYLYFSAQGEGWIVPWGAWGPDGGGLAERYWAWERHHTSVTKRAPRGTASLNAAALARIGIPLGTVQLGRTGGDWLAAIDHFTRRQEATPTGARP